MNNNHELTTVMRTVTTLIVLISFLLTTHHVAGQSKKEQIKGMNVRIDSFRIAVDSLHRSIHDKDLLLKEATERIANLQSKVTESEADVQKKALRITALTRTLDSLRVFLSEFDTLIVRRQHKAYVMKMDTEVTDVTSTVFLTDLDGDQIAEAVVDYCCKTALSGKPYDEGAMWGFPECMKNGISIYRKSPDGRWGFIDAMSDSVYYTPYWDLGTKGAIKASNMECRVAKCQDGKILLSGILYGDGDALCCPSLELRSYLVLNKNKLTLPKQDRRVVKQN